MNKMRRSDRAMGAEEARELLVRGEYGILSTVDEEGQPYGTPLSYVFKDNKIYFHCAVEGRKLLNLQANPKVCFTVVGRTNILPQKFSTEYESVMAFGRAEVVDEDEKVSALKELILKYSPDFIDDGNVYIEKAKDKTFVVRIDVEDFTGKHRPKK